MTVTTTATVKVRTPELRAALAAVFPHRKRTKRDDDIVLHRVRLILATVCEGPARPVEDREPVGPYAPTRDGRTLNARYEADPGLFEAGYRQGWRERDINGVPRYHDLTKWDGTYGGRGDHPDTVAELKRIRETEFERGRQQGDADRAQRGQTDHGPNGLWAQQAEALARTRAEGFKAGREIGKAEREAELLDQGWTPPGATSVDARLLEIVNSGYPTEYEVWRDAVAIAGAQRDRRPPAKDLAERLTADAEWFWELLQQVPVRKYDDADEYVCEACGDEFPSAGQRAAHEDEKHAATGQ